MPTLPTLTSFTPSQVQQLIPIAKQLGATNPAALVHDQVRFLAEIMVHAKWKSVCEVGSILSKAHFQEVLKNPPPGIFEGPAWHFWHKRYKLPVPPLPPRPHVTHAPGIILAKNFHDQYKIGAAGEQIMLQQYGSLLGATKPDGLESDLYLAGIQLHLEHKTDSYDMRKTLNFFIEKTSNKNAGTIGGPARAVQHRVPLFSYLFSEQQICYWFESQTLHELTQKYISDHNPELKDIPNRDPDTGRTWITQGYKIPRDYLESSAITTHNLAQPIPPSRVYPIILWATRKGQAFQPGHHPNNLPMPARLASRMSNQVS